MRCPSCHAGVLQPSELDGRLACRACNQCAGAPVELSTYGRWITERHGATAAPPAQAEAFEVADTRQALCCPACQRLMVKFKVMADTAHGLHFCFHCEKVWLDAGEWNYLGGLGPQTRIRSVSTEPWQRRIREEHGARQRLALLKQAMGEDAFGRAEKFRAWLRQQPARADILRYLNAED